MIADESCWSCGAERRDLVFTATLTPGQLVTQLDDARLACPPCRADRQARLNDRALGALMPARPESGRCWICSRPGADLVDFVADPVDGRGRLRESDAIVVHAECLDRTPVDLDAPMPRSRDW